MADPVSKAQLDPNFEVRLRDLQKHAAAEHDARTSGDGQVRWDRPGSYAGDLFDLKSMHEPFSRERANSDYLAAVTDPENPGTVGDVIATTTMIDYLAVMERAFRMRHTMRRPRAVALMLGRKRGLGGERGPFIQAGVEYVRSLLKQAKQKG